MGLKEGEDSDGATILTQTAGNGEGLERKIWGDNLAMANSSFSEHFMTLTLSTYQ